MATWVDCNGSGNYFGGFACDMGPYIGPWPLLPPGEMGGLDSVARDELDFYVMLPNPADPTDVTIVGDGSYDTPLWDAYRYFTNSTPPMGFGYFGDWSGPGASSPVPPTPPAGAHLYVVAYADAGAPPNPPEFYVPASYAAGGSAAHETAMGHWSSDQASYDTSRRVFAGNLVNPISSQSIEVDHGDQDVPAAMNAMIAAILASSTSAGTFSDFNYVAAAKDPDGWGFLDPKCTAWLTVYLLIIAYDGTSAIASGPSSPPALHALEYGVDYADSPYIGSDGSDGPDHQLTGSPTWNWGLSADVGPAAASVSHEEFQAVIDAPPDGTLPPDGDNTPLGLETRAAWEPGDTTGSATWTSSGTVLGDFPPVDDTGLSLTPPNLVFDYSAITNEAFTLHLAPKFLYDGSVAGVTDFAIQGHGHITSFRDRMIFFPGDPQMVVHSGPWRYWVPGAIVPTGIKWHNFTGHWQRFDGETLNIFTPGFGPVPMVDGLP